MSPLRRRKRADASAPTPNYLADFLAQPVDVGTRAADVEAVAQADADHAAEAARIEQFVKTEEAFDRNAPRPPVLGIDF
jgi:hypothetical protein